MRARWIRLGAAEPPEFEAATARLAAAQSSLAAPILLWGEAVGHYPFALIAPLRLAPGRPARWGAWGLAPAVATYRQFRLPAYLNEGELWLHGRRVGAAAVARLGECLVVASSFMMQFRGSCASTPSAELEQAFRLRLEAQHGWQFDHSWPSRPEALRYALA